MDDIATHARRGPFDTGPISRPGPIESGERDARLDNQPPLEDRILMDFEDDVQREGIAARIAELLASAQRAPQECADADVAGKIGDLCKQARAIGQRLEDARERHNRQLIDARTSLKAKADGLISPLNEAIAKIRAALDDWTANEAEKRRQEELRAAEARRIAEAAAAEALKAQGFEDQIPEDHPIMPPPLAAQRAPIARGSLGSSVGATQIWNFEIENMRQVPDRYLKHPKVKEALESVIRAAIRTEKVREMKGVRIWPGTKAAIR